MSEISYEPPISRDLFVNKESSDKLLDKKDRFSELINRASGLLRKESRNPRELPFKIQLELKLISFYDRFISPTGYTAAVSDFDNYLRSLKEAEWLEVQKMVQSNTDFASVLGQEMGFSFAGLSNESRSRATNLIKLSSDFANGFKSGREAWSSAAVYTILRALA